MAERRALTEQVARRYRGASKKQQAVMLGECVETTGYARKYAILLLNSWGRIRVVRIDGQMVKLVVGRPRARQAPRATAPLRLGGAEGQGSGPDRSPQHQTTVEAR